MKQCRECFKYFRKASKGKVCPFCGSNNVHKIILHRGIIEGDTTHPRYSIDAWVQDVQVHNLQMSA